MLLECFACAVGGVLAGVAIGRALRERRLGRAWSEGYQLGLEIGQKRHRCSCACGHAGGGADESHVVTLSPQQQADLDRVMAQMERDRSVGRIEFVHGDEPQGFGPYGES